MEGRTMLDISDMTGTKSTIYSFHWILCVQTIRRLTNNKICPFLKVPYWSNLEGAFWRLIRECSAVEETELLPQESYRRSSSSQVPRPFVPKWRNLVVGECTRLVGWSTLDESLLYGEQYVSNISESRARFEGPDEYCLPSMTSSPSRSMTVSSMLSAYRILKCGLSSELAPIS